MLVRFILFTVLVAPSQTYFDFISALQQKHLPPIAALQYVLSTGALLFYSLIILADAHVRLSDARRPIYLREPTVHWLRLLISIGFAPVGYSLLALMLGPLSGPWLQAEEFTAVYALCVAVSVYTFTK
jgi:hypothetical protein